MSREPMKRPAHRGSRRLTPGDQEHPQEASYVARGQALPVDFRREEHRDEVTGGIGAAGGY